VRHIAVESFWEVEIMGKFVLIAVFVLYAKGEGQNHIKEITRVETWGVFEKLEDCKAETNIPFGLIPPGLAWLDCVPLKVTP
jgi:hypothetical protein